jgi:hypothetical protein
VSTATSLAGDVWTGSKSTVARRSATLTSARNTPGTRRSRR